MIMWDELAKKLKDAFAVLEKVEAKSKQIRRMSYRKTKSQRRRG